MTARFSTLTLAMILSNVAPSALAHAATPADDPAPASATPLPPPTKRKDAVAKSGEGKPVTMKFSYKNVDINRVIEDYAKSSGQRFVVDGTVKGRITIFNPTPVGLDEAFNQLSEALASNSLAISSRDDIMYVSSARMIQRDLIPVVTELPPVRPDRMVTLVVNLKHASAEEINRQLRILTSRDGELVLFTPNNQLLISDWTPNLHRIADIVKALDIPSDNPTTPSEPPPAALAEPSPAEKDEGADKSIMPAIPRLKATPAAKKK